LAKPLKVAVGSTNPVKIKATKKAMTKIYGRGKVKVRGVKVSSGVPIQPLGFQTLQGAVNRALEALKRTGADLGVGIEAGLFPEEKTLTGYMDFQWCAIADRKGIITVGCGPGFEMPPRIVESVLKGEGEVGKLVEKIFGVRKVKETIGAVGILSRGIVDRAKLAEIAVLMAMIPRINPKTYFKHKKH
jgi:inosine/xanthosine triphosphatase